MSMAKTAETPKSTSPAIVEVEEKNALGRAAVEERWLSKMAEKLPEEMKITARRDFAHEAAMAFFEAITELLKENVGSEGFKIRIPKFGKWEVHHKAARMRRNPKTGEKKMGSAFWKIKFVVSPEWRENIETIK
jgi:nucleoid DNA-binding protein